VIRHHITLKVVFKENSDKEITKPPLNSKISS